MHKTTARCLMTILITLLMVLTVTQPIIGGAGGYESASDTVETSPVNDNDLPPGPEINKDGFNYDKDVYFNTQSDKSSGNGKLAKVIVATTDVAALANLLSGYEYNGLLGTKTTNTKGIAFPILEVPRDALMEISQLPNVLGVYDYQEPVTDLKNEKIQDILKNILDPETLSQKENVDPATLYHGAEKAWANGFTGSGVKVATISSGCDFGNYELSGRQAIVGDEYFVSVTDQIVVDTTDVVEGNKTRLDIPDYYLVFVDTCVLSQDGSVMSSGYTLFENGTILFAPELPAGTLITGSYTYVSPYYQYPIAFDPTSMLDYLSDGPQPETVTPSDNWYVNTSSTDLRILHTPIIDGTNDFWEELNLHGTADDTFNLSLTNELRGADKTYEISAQELDLSSLYVTSDKDNWFVGFDVFPEVYTTPTWLRDYDVRYGIYIDTTAGVGATTDPLNNFINTTAANQPEYAMYIHHTSEDWGVSDGLVWSNNNTIQNASFYAWDQATSSWSDEIILTLDQPYNETVGIGPGWGSSIMEDNNNRYVKHDGQSFLLRGNNSNPFYIYYNQSGYDYVDLEMIKGDQDSGDDFVELSMQRDVFDTLLHRG